MAAKFRNVIAANVLNSVKETSTSETASSGGLRQLAGQIKLGQSRADRINFSIRKGLIPHFSAQHFTDFQHQVPEIHEVEEEKNLIKFVINKDKFIKEVLHTTATRPRGYKWNRNALFDQESKHVIVEFSSPNIAKPFHIGHFRSTIVGSFVANFHQLVGQKVTRINWLGDWGTQFGYLLAGMDQFNLTLDDLKEDTLTKLLKIYIDANKLGEQDEVFFEKAREKFSSLERGEDSGLLEYWKYFRSFSVEELKKVYARLGIEFDEYSGESFYSGQKSEQVLNLFKSSNLLQDSEGSKEVQLPNGRKVRIVKRDGSSLYITRDVAAAIHRYEEYKFDKMIYVVDNEQTQHLRDLFSLLDTLGYTWSQHCSHVRFGKIKGLSTRKGNIVLLDSIVDEAKIRMKEKQDNSKTTRVQGEEAERAAQILGLSALVVTDFKHRRVKDYSFSWDHALSSKGETGVRLQYLHARLNSLLENCGVELDVGASTLPLTEDCAHQLALHLGKWDECLQQSYVDLEPRVITSYLFQLSDLTNRCFKELAVKGQDPDLARARILLFYSSKRILADGLQLMGLQPLDRM